MGELSTLRVAALTSGRNVPSARFRVRQHIPFLRELGVVVDEYVPLIDKFVTLGAGHPLVPRTMKPAVARLLRALSLATRRSGIRASHRADVTWLERELVPGGFSLEDQLGKPLVLDVDDAIWVHREARLDQLARLSAEADVVIAGNDFIADWFRPHARLVEVIPSAVDTRRFAPIGESRRDGPLRVGWTGTNSNFGYLQLIEGALAAFLDSTDAVLVVVADREPRLPMIPPHRLIFKRWSSADEADAVRHFDIGLMPLRDDEWGRGKCGYKALQYMACGVPAIVSPVGFNRRLIAGGGAIEASGVDGWIAALESLAVNPERRRAIGEAGRSVVTREYSCEVVSTRIASVLRNAARRAGMNRGSA